MKENIQRETAKISRQELHHVCREMFFSEGARPA
jgi:hypothetical protein